MNVRRWNAIVWLVLLTAAALTSACRRTYVIVPRPSGGYRPDTLRATLNGNTARVIFRFDTVTHTRNVYITDTLWREGTRIIRDTVFRVRRDTIRVVRRDTLRLIRRDTVRIVRVDTVHSVTGSGRVDTVRYAVRDTVIVERQLPPVVRVDTVRVVVRDSVVVTREAVRVDTVRRSDTVYVARTDRGRAVDTVYLSRQERGGRVDTVRVVRTDTVRVTRVDTVRVARVDTVRVARVDTVRLAGRRMLFVPPGQYPPTGQCRVWIHDRPPGQQRDAAPCDALGDIPAGAFILFGGEAWDFDYDWVAEDASGRVPPQIVALKRRRP